MANYFVINNKFKPYSFDELIRPYQIYGQAYKEQEALLDDAVANEFSPDNLDATQDKAAYDMYNAADQGLRAVSDELATRGLSPQLRNRLKNTAKEYKRTMTSLTNAQEQLNAERDRRAKLGPDYVYQQGDLRIGDFLGGNRPNDESASLSGITKDIAAEFGARAKGITSDTWDKVFASNGKVISGYFDVRTDEGLTAAQLDTILDGVVTGDGSTWASVMNNPTITDEQKKQLQGFRNSIISKKDSLGFGNYDLGAQRKINEAIVLGAHGGLGTTTHKYQVDKNFISPELSYRMQRDKAEDKYKAEQKAIDAGEKPFYTDDNGNQWFKKGNIVWAKDKDGKTVQNPIPAGQLGKTSSSGAKSASGAAIPDTVTYDFPWYTKGNKDLTVKGKGDNKYWAYNEAQGRMNEISVRNDLSQSQLKSLADKLAKVKLTIDDVRVFRDYDALSRNEYKIVLKSSIDPNITGYQGVDVIGTMNPDTGEIADTTGTNVPYAPDAPVVNRENTAAGSFGGF